METHVKVCLKSDWSMYFKEADFKGLLHAWEQGILIELENLFGAREVIDGKQIASLFVSTREARLKYERFAHMLSKEEEEVAEESEKEEKPEWLK